MMLATAEISNPQGYRPELQLTILDIRQLLKRIGNLTNNIRKQTRQLLRHIFPHQVYMICILNDPLMESIFTPNHLYHR